MADAHRLSRALDRHALRPSLTHKHIPPPEQQIHRRQHGQERHAPIERDEQNVLQSSIIEHNLQLLVSNLPVKLLIIPRTAAPAMLARKDFDNLSSLFYDLSCFVNLSCLNLRFVLSNCKFVLSLLQI